MRGGPGEFMSVASVRRMPRPRKHPVVKRKPRQKRTPMEVLGAPGSRIGDKYTAGKKLTASRYLTADERLWLKVHLLTWGRKVADESKRARPPSSPANVLEAARQGVQIGESTVRRLVQYKKVIVCQARQRMLKRKGKRLRQYLQELARLGLDPGWLAGVDGQNWA